MIHQPAQQQPQARRLQAIEAARRGSTTDAHTPIWRRVTALFSLGALVVLIGVVLAAVIASAALLALFVLERAIAG